MSIALLLAVVATQTPDLAGIDTIPSSSSSSLSSLSSSSSSSSLLQAVALDAQRDVVVRARAVRHLGAGAATDGVDAVLAQLSTSTTGELQVQVALARFDRAMQRSRVAAVALTSSMMASPVPALRRAAALMWWRLGGNDGHAAVERGAHDVDAGVRAACVARLRWWSRSGGSTSTSSNVLQQNHDAGPYAPARR